MDKIQPELFDTVELLRDLPSDGLRAGAQGAIVEDYGDGHFEIEFVNNKGETDALLTLTLAQFIVVWRQATHEPVSTTERITQLVERLEPQAQAQMLTFGQFLHVRRQQRVAA